MRISDWSSDVCSSDLSGAKRAETGAGNAPRSGNSAGSAHREAACSQCGCRDDGTGAELRGARDQPGRNAGTKESEAEQGQDRKSVAKGKSVSVRVNHGGRVIIKTKRHQNKPRN